ncbi:putative membrane protein YqhA [Bradyrhizobium sp. LM2.7]
MKIKLAMAIIGISSIALLRTFIEAGNLGSGRASFTEQGVMWQVLIPPHLCGLGDRNCLRRQAQRFRHAQAG